MQAALHQQLAPALVNELDAAGRRRVAVPRVDDLVTRDVHAELTRRVGDFCRRPDQDRLDDPGLGGVGGAAQRSLVAWVHDDRRRGRHFLRARDKTFVFRLRRAGDRTDGRQRADLAVFGEHDELSG